MSLFSRVKASGLLAASLVASAALTATTASAQQPQSQVAQPAEPDVDVGQVSTGSHIIVIGAINDPSDRSAPVAEDPRVPELPVVYEDSAAAPKSSSQGAASPPASAAR